MRPSYDISTGEVVLDLTRVRDLSALDGRTVHLSADVGHLEVIVPRDLSTRVVAGVHGPGEIRLFGDQRGGVDTTMVREADAAGADPSLVIDADLDVGLIEVHQR